MSEQDPFAELLGIEHEETVPGHALLHATPGPEHCNQFGSVHGGFVFALADAALASAANSHGPEAVALAASIHFARPARPGEALAAEAIELARSARTASYEVTVRSAEGLIATFTGTVFRKP